MITVTSAGLTWTVETAGAAAGVVTVWNDVTVATV